MSVVPNSEWYETTHHELGHIYYYLSYTNPDVPPLLRGGANRAYHDALSHSFEALWNRNSNPVSDHFAFESIKLIIKYIEGLNDPVPEDVRKGMILAAMYAGLAFSNTKTAAATRIGGAPSVVVNEPAAIGASEVESKATRAGVALVLEVGRRPVSNADAGVKAR